MLNRFEAFNLTMMSKMQNRRPQPSVVMGSNLAAAGSGRSGTPDVTMTDASSAQGAGGGASGTGAAGQAKKKKPKKKK